jgi:GTP 3',8-cyclase
MNLTDRFNREHKYLRISVTDRCNYKCIYCMPKDGIKWQPKSEILLFEEIAYLAHIFCKMGITHIRLTGGEPTLRSDICSLISALSSTSGLKDLSITTNGHQLMHLGGSLKDAGLNRCNISIDSLNHDTFKKLTRGGNLKRVLRGIQTAINVGLTPIKLNVVLLKDENDHEILDFIHFCSGYADVLQVRFIEYMPFEMRWHKCVSSKEILKTISKEYEILESNKINGLGPSKEFYIPKLGVRFGIITPLSNSFCQSCNRLRLMADGQLRTCLSNEKHSSLKDIIRSNHTEELLSKKINEIVFNKVEKHECNEDDGNSFEGIMTRIGG